MRLYNSNNTNSNNNNGGQQQRQIFEQKKNQVYNEIEWCLDDDVEVIER